MDIGGELFTLPEPPPGRVPGTLAYSAWLMVESGMMSGDEADRAWAVYEAEKAASAK